MRGAWVGTVSGEGELTVTAACGGLSAVAHLVVGSLAPSLIALPGSETWFHFEEVTQEDPPSFRGAPRPRTIKRSAKIRGLSVVLKTAEGRPMPNETIHWKVPFRHFRLFTSFTGQIVLETNGSTIVLLSIVLIINARPLRTRKVSQRYPSSKCYQGAVSQSGMPIPGGEIVINVPVQATWGSTVAVINLACPFTGVSVDGVWSTENSQSRKILSPMPNRPNPAVERTRSTVTGCAPAPFARSAFLHSLRLLRLPFTFWSLDRILYASFSPSRHRCRSRACLRISAYGRAP